ncbi:Auxin-responsive protein SAUR32 [Spatholobus suberectus]|nr:Auxin-responsive protein SAUR32 [Spatholobus suberectus]
MAELNVKSSSKKRVVGGILKFKSVLEKLQKSLVLRRHKSSSSCYEEGDDTTCVPEDVKEGHFVVIAKDKEEAKRRFVVPLSCLNNPTFFRLLEEAAEEYGFDQHGALTIPCRPSELEMLLSQQWKERGRF